MPTPTTKPPISELKAHLFTGGVIALGLVGVALLEYTDRLRDPLAGWYLLIWPFMLVCGSVAYVVSGDPEQDGFVRRGALLILGLQLGLAALQLLMYALPDPGYDAWLAGRPDSDAPYTVEPWLVAVVHVVGLVVAPVIGILLRNIRRLWAVGVEEPADR